MAGIEIPPSARGRKGVRNKKACIAEDCGAPAHSRGMCEKHYKRFHRHGSPAGGGTAKGDLVKFLYNVAIPSKTEACLRWPFAQNGVGYPVITIDGERKYAHRLVCEAAHGAPPTQNHEVAHACGNGHLGCVNPRHLRWATRPENMDDKVIHGTASRGVRHGNSKLSDDDVRSIRAMEGSACQREIADAFNVVQQTVHQILRRKSWAWLD